MDDSLSTVLGVSNDGNPATGDTLLDNPVRGDANYVYVNDPNQQGHPHIHTSFDD